MYKLFIVLAVTVLFTLTGFKYKTQNTEWTLVSSSVTFKIKNAGFTVDGKFGAMSGTILFDPAKTTDNSIDVSINAESISTGNGTRDGHLKKKEYFDVATYPKISMKGTLIAKLTDGTYKGYFKLTLKGKTKDVVMPFTFSESDGKGTFKGTLKINRLDYGVGGSSIVMSDDVNLSIVVSTVKKQ
ncbi:MAG: YceI family protein [Bacteroidia bacterium]|nr:YceI family protein [Bacteroidia bacterium]